MPQPTTDAAAPIGLIGLGLLGRAMAARLLNAGFRIAGHDISQAAVTSFEKLGPHAVAATPSDILQRCRTVVFSLPSHLEVAAVLSEHHGSLASGLTMIDTTTGDPSFAEQTAAELEPRGIHFLDATVSGSSAHLEAGDAVLMVGGGEDAFIRHHAVFRALARDTFHTGPAGSGSKMKLVTNLVLGLNRAALGEGLVFAECLGLDAEATLKILQSGAAASRIMDSKGPKMIARDYVPQARLKQHLKDVQLMISAAEATGVRLPLTQTHRTILERAVALGFADADNCALIEALRQREPQDD